MELASVWMSILENWFPSVEGYQFRLNPKTTWVEVYVIRIARAPNELEVTVNPAFVVRCYGPGPWNPIRARFANEIGAKMPDEVLSFCKNINAVFFLTHGAIAFQKSVRFVRFDWELERIKPVPSMPSTYPIALDGLIPKHLDHVKAHFAELWGYPYSEYWDLTSSTEGENEDEDNDNGPEDGPDAETRSHHEDAKEDVKEETKA